MLISGHDINVLNAFLLKQGSWGVKTHCGTHSEAPQARTVPADMLHRGALRSFPSPSPPSHLLHLLLTQPHKSTLQQLCHSLQPKTESQEGLQRRLLAPEEENLMSHSEGNLKALDTVTGPDSTLRFCSIKKRLTVTAADPKTDRLWKTGSSEKKNKQRNKR